MRLISIFATAKKNKNIKHHLEEALAELRSQNCSVGYFPEIKAFQIRDGNKEMQEGGRLIQFKIQDAAILIRFGIEKTHGGVPYPYWNANTIVFKDFKDVPHHQAAEFFKSDFKDKLGTSIAENALDDSQVLSGSDALPQRNI